MRASARRSCARSGGADKPLPREQRPRGRATRDCFDFRQRPRDTRKFERALCERERERHTLFPTHCALSYAPLLARALVRGARPDAPFGDDRSRAACYSNLAELAFLAKHAIAGFALDLLDLASKTLDDHSKANETQATRSLNDTLEIRVLFFFTVPCFFFGPLACLLARSALPSQRDTGAIRGSFLTTYLYGTFPDIEIPRDSDVSESSNALERASCGFPEHSYDTNTREPKYTQSQPLSNTQGRILNRV